MAAAVPAPNETVSGDDNLPPQCIVKPTRKPTALAAAIRHTPPNVPAPSQEPVQVDNPPTDKPSPATPTVTPQVVTPEQIAKALNQGSLPPELETLTKTLQSFTETVKTLQPFLSQLNQQQLLQQQQNILNLQISPNRSVRSTEQANGNKEEITCTQVAPIPPPPPPPPPPPEPTTETTPSLPKKPASTSDNLKSPNPPVYLDGILAFGKGELKLRQTAHAKKEAPVKADTVDFKANLRRSNSVATDEKIEKSVKNPILAELGKVRLKKTNTSSPQSKTVTDTVDPDKENNVNPFATLRPVRSPSASISLPKTITEEGNEKSPIGRFPLRKVNRSINSVGSGFSKVLEEQNQPISVVRDVKKLNLNRKSISEEILSLQIADSKKSLQQPENKSINHDKLDSSKFVNCKLEYRDGTAKKDEKAPILPPKPKPVKPKPIITPSTQLSETDKDGSDKMANDDQNAPFVVDTEVNSIETIQMLSIEINETPLALSIGCGGPSQNPCKRSSNETEEIPINKDLCKDGQDVNVNSCSEAELISSKEVEKIETEVSMQEPNLTSDNNLTNTISPSPPPPLPPPPPPNMPPATSTERVILPTMKLHNTPPSGARDALLASIEAFDKTKMVKVVSETQTPKSKDVHNEDVDNLMRSLGKIIKERASAWIDPESDMEEEENDEEWGTDYDSSIKH